AGGWRLRTCWAAVKLPTCTDAAGAWGARSAVCPAPNPCFKAARREILANIVVNVELREGIPTAPSLFALSEARRVARSLGATVYAFVVGEAMVPLVDSLAEPLGRAGADKALFLADPLAAACPVEPLWREVLDLIVERLRPRLVLWPAGSIGHQLGPLLAVRLGASFFPRASLELADPVREGAASDFVRAPGEPALTARRWTDSHDGFFTVGVGANWAPVVAIMPAGPVPELGAGGAAEIGVLDARHEEGRGVEVLAREPAPRASAELASTVVVLAPSDQAAFAGVQADLLRDDVLVIQGAEALTQLEHASPRLVLLLSSRAGTAALSRLRVAPDAHVVALSAGRRASPQSPIVDRVWKTDRAAAAAKLEAALTKADRPRDIAVGESS
ncbi:MAG TPA: hypothetical protein VGF45_21485, partial [Polyangia bacterium]